MLPKQEGYPKGFSCFHQEKIRDICCPENTGARMFNLIKMSTLNKWLYNAELFLEKILEREALLLL